MTKSLFEDCSFCIDWNPAFLNFVQLIVKHSVRKNEAYPFTPWSDRDSFSLKISTMSRRQSSDKNKEKYQLGNF